MMNTFYSALSLIICGGFILIIMGWIYLFKIKDKKLTFLNKLFLILYFITMILIILEFVFYFAAQHDNIFRQIVGRTYVFFGMSWGFSVLLYVSSLIRIKNAKDFDKKYFRKINISVLIIEIILLGMVSAMPLEYRIGDAGDFYILDGLLNTVYNRLSIFSNATLLILMTINFKKLPKPFVLMSYFVFALYITNFILEGALNYSIKESVFMYSILVFVLYNSTESQDKQLYEDYIKAKKHSEEIDAQKTKFLLNMSYEIRTPLNTILSYSNYLLMLKDFNQLKVEEEGENIYQASLELLNLINNILDISKIDSNKETLVDTEYSFDSIILNVNSNIQPLASSSNIKFNMNIDENLPAKYIGDVAKLEKIIISFLLNAINHTNLGEVSLNVNGNKTDDENIDMEFIIKNSGHTMKEEEFNIDLENIMSLNNEEKITNNKLGLIIAKKMVSMLGGTIEFINQPNMGTQYIIKIKQKYVNNYEVIGKYYDKINNLSGNKIYDCLGKSALIVDDDNVNLGIAKRVLSKFRFDIDLVSSGAEAIEAVQKKKYDVIFLDHMMPVMDGIQVLNKLKEILPDMPPVIALTANSNDDSKIEYMSKGFTDYLTKPINFGSLNELINKLFNNM